MNGFEADCRAVLIGSFPHLNHRDAVSLIFDHTPQIPIWPQLPHFREEGMLLQFLPGLPGITEEDGKVFIDSSTEEFETEFLAFFEDYLGVIEGAIELRDSRFALGAKEAPGFELFLDEAERRQADLVALKGQITGPVTFCTGLTDQQGRALFYDEQLRDAAVKLLALKARYMTRKMAEIKKRPLLFFDEPGLAGFGSSAFITITPEDINVCLSEVFESVRQEGGLSGVHVCANTEWPVIFNTGIDVISYDAYSYFDKLILFGDHLIEFLHKGGILATGIVPTTAEFIERETINRLIDAWADQLDQIASLGVEREKVVKQTLITPSCGTGTVTEAQAQRVVEMTRDVSAAIRERFF
ncbi:MAG: hypothetical protein KJO60_14590 [Desulfofustis sp.]|nr:hypothetical protein [Desulfofustis sp.]NNK56471.1 hypothetical protein [Desulfofustis sp.]